MEKIGVREGLVVPIERHNTFSLKRTRQGGKFPKLPPHKGSLLPCLRSSSMVGAIPCGALGERPVLSLTEREREVLRLVAEGHTDRKVAEALVISTRTVNRHLSNIFMKLDVPGRAGAVAYAIRQGLV